MPYTRFFLGLLIGALLSSCGHAQPVREGSVPQTVALQTAHSVMTRTPQLMNRWHYEVGTMLKGMEALWRATGDPRYLAFIQSNIDAFVQDDGSIRTYRLEEYNLDQVNTGKLLFTLYEETGQEKYRIALEHVRDQLRTHPRTHEGGFWHKLVYPHQMWLDGLYMAGPFYAQHARLHSDDAAFDDITLQFALMYRHSRDARTGLLYHGWDESRTQIWADSLTGLSPNFWARAMGWYAMALVDALDFYPEAHPGRALLISLLQDLAQSVRAVQDPVSGLWYQVLDAASRPGNYLEASASAMFVYAFAKGVRKGYLPDSYRHTARHGFNGLLSRMVSHDDAGLLSLNGICSVAGLGGRQQRDGSFAYYISEPIVSNDFKGVGPFLMAAVELEYLAP